MIPLTRQASSPHSSGARAAQIGQSVLAVDDDATARERIARELNRAGFAVRTVASYREWEEAWDSGPAPDLVILDVLLAEREDGYEILRTMRTGKKSSVPVLILSSRSSAVDKAYARVNGAAAYVSKEPGEFDHPDRGLVPSVRRLLSE